MTRAPLVALLSVPTGFRSFSWGYQFLGLTKHLKWKMLSKIRKNASLS